MPERAYRQIAKRVAQLHRERTKKEYLATHKGKKDRDYSGVVNLLGSVESELVSLMPDIMRAMHEDEDDA